jgi:hypothetical protein
MKGEVGREQLSRLAEELCVELPVDSLTVLVSIFVGTRWAVSDRVRATRRSVGLGPKRTHDGGQIEGELPLHGILGANGTLQGTLWQQIRGRVRWVIQQQKFSMISSDDAGRQ